MASTLTAKIQRTPKATPKTVHIDKLKHFVGTPPRSWINGAAENTDTTEVLSPVEQPGNASFPPEASEQHRRREYGQPPRFVLDDPTSMHDGVISSRPGPDKTLVKRRCGRTLVDGRSEVVRESNINEATRSLQPSPGWLPNEVANFQSMSDQPSNVPSYNLSLKAKPFIPRRREHGTLKQHTVKKRRSRRRRKSIRKLRLIMF